MAYSQAFKDEALRRWREGRQTSEQVALAMGCSPQIIGYWARRAGLVERGSRRQQTRLRRAEARVVELGHAGWCLSCVAAELRINWRTARDMFRAAGIPPGPPGGAHRAIPSPPCMKARHEASIQRKQEREVVPYITRRDLAGDGFALTWERARSRAIKSGATDAEALAAADRAVAALVPAVDVGTLECWERRGGLFDELEPLAV